MIEPSLALQIAITAALKAAAIGAPIHDQVPANAPLPYVETGDDQVVPNPAEGFNLAATVHTTLHVYAARAGGGRRQAKTIAGAIVAALDNAPLDLSASGWALNVIQHASTRQLDDPDGSVHAVVTFTALVDPA